MDKKYLLKVALESAREGMVLLKNRDGALPLKREEKTAAFGRTFYFCFSSGAGSGAVLGKPAIDLYDCFLKENCELDREIADFYHSFNQKRYESELKYFNRVDRKWVNSLSEAPINEKMIKDAAKRNSTAIINIARTSGEWIDVKKEAGGYYLTDIEKAVLKNVKKYFKKTVLLLNVHGVTDMRFISSLDFDAILYTALGGEEMGRAVADIVFGNVSPSGRLTDTFADIDDFPTNKGFDSLEIPYNEGIYVGYRYFDTFNKSVCYPFGFGLSYSDFIIDTKDVSADKTQITITANVENCGNFASKEVVQVYLSEPAGRLDKAYQQLAGFAKTDTLKPGESEEVAVSFDLASFACFDTQSESYILEKGAYTVRIGKNSRNTDIAAVINLTDTVTVKKVKNLFSDTDRLNLIAPMRSKPERKEEALNFKLITISKDQIKTEKTVYSKDPEAVLTEGSGKADIFLSDVYKDESLLKKFVSQFTDGELSDILNGVTASTLSEELHVGTMARTVDGAAGEIFTSKKYKIPPCVNADGPAGIRLGGFVGKNPVPKETEYSLKMTAFPTATTIANSFNLKLAEEFGRCVGFDMDTCKVSGWLAPGMNIHRNPLCGRNFEYFSEDPLVSGLFAAAVVKGCQTEPDGSPAGRYATIKHFAANHAENNRFDSDSIVSERALREIYLRAFETAVKKGKPLAVMNSYNKLNGEYTSDSMRLNTYVLRDEWGFDGCVMTDWCAKSSAKYMVNSGCDLVMPGLKNKEYLSLIKSGEISRAKARISAERIIKLILRTSCYKNEKPKSNGLI